jgi:Uma2 family endonuclease
MGTMMVAMDILLAPKAVDVISTECMSASVRTPMTLAEFLDWEERQEFKYEFDGFAPVAMVGGTQEHNGISINLTGMLRERLRGKPCRPYGSDMKVEVAGSLRYPDAIVVSREYPRGTTVFPDPVAVFEVISPSTARTDRILKNREYRDTQSVRYYVMLEQDFVGAMVFSRSDGKWAGATVAGDGTIALPELDIELPMSELYEGVALADPA